MRAICTAAREEHVNHALRLYSARRIANNTPSRDWRNRWSTTGERERNSAVRLGTLCDRRRAVTDQHLSHDPETIFAWRRIGPRLTSSGQPSEAELADIHDLGVSHVVNLGLHSHERALPDEAGSVAALSMRYIHLPVDFTEPREADYARFRETMQKLAGETVHVHCIANLRVSAFLYRYRRDELGVPDAAALADLEALWRPGGAWARLVGHGEDEARDHLYALRDYPATNRSR
jgi:protein tyrosine phosphatase (PTP) superfamily phosphohydrolase (DUF442 family)